MDDEKVKIVCSCIPGFESIALKECKTRLDIDAFGDIRGRIHFQIDINNITKLLQLRSVHHYWVVVEEIETFLNDEKLKTKEDIFAKFHELPPSLKWEKSLRTWKHFKVVQQDSKKQTGETHNEENKKMKADNDISNSNVDDKLHTPVCKSYHNIEPATAGEDIRFRVTASRTGNHDFSSMESAVHLGAGVNEFFQWKVDLTNFDIEVVSFILDDSVLIGIQLTKESQALRNITHFGPTTLKANIAYCLLELAAIECGDVICDPMCGGGSISLEGCLSFPTSFNICGDNHATAVEYAGENFVDICRKSKTTVENQATTKPYSVLRWDVYHLPLRTGCVDRIVSDLPFGKKIGSKERNLFLYPIALEEMARICRPNGKAVLLTQHKQAILKALGKSKWWKFQEKRVINMGGLNVTVFLLCRNKYEYQRPVDKNIFVK